MSQGPLTTWRVSTVPWRSDFLLAAPVIFRGVCVLSLSILLSHSDAWLDVMGDRSGLHTPPEFWQVPARHMLLVSEALLATSPLQLTFGALRVARERRRDPLSRTRSQ